MLYICFKNNLPTEVSTECPKPRTYFVDGNGWQSSRDAKDFEQATTWAAYLTALTGKTYLPVDHGERVWPQFSVIEAPQVGDPVSYGFNGDYYPCGTIVKITKGWRITTSTGKVFNRRKNSAGWRAVGGTWSMVAGHIDERNPHF